VKKIAVPFFSIVCIKFFIFYPQVEHEPDEQELQELEFELTEDEVFPVQNPQPLKILLIFLLLHFTQDILPSSISLIVALTSKLS